VHAAVAAVMNGLVTERFTEEHLVVTVQLHDAMTLSVTDLPGLRPPNASGAAQDNTLIARIWAKCCAKASSVPLMTLKLHKDDQEMESDIETLKKAMGATPETLSRAVVIVGHLDERIRELDYPSYMKRTLVCPRADGNL
jgi:hypothetical protein